MPDSWAPLELDKQQTHEQLMRRIKRLENQNLQLEEQNAQKDNTIAKLEEEIRSFKRIAKKAGGV